MAPGDVFSDAVSVAGGGTTDISLGANQPVALSTYGIHDFDSKIQVSDAGGTFGSAAVLSTASTGGPAGDEQRLVIPGGGTIRIANNTCVSHSFGVAGREL